MDKLCSIFFYEGYLSLAPTIINLSKVLDQHGYSVTLFTIYNNAITQPKKSEVE